MGGTSYFIVEKDLEGRSGNLLIDVPAYQPDVLTFIQNQGGVSQLVITHRGAIGEARALQVALQCDVVVQEQESYLLSDLANLVTYQEHLHLGGHCEVFWTPGHSPGAACVHSKNHGGILFTGRHLLPDRQGRLMPLRFSKTFHWPRQLRSVKKLQAKFSAETLAYVCPGANTGFLRGKHIIADGYSQLQAIDVDNLFDMPILL